MAAVRHLRFSKVRNTVNPRINELRYVSLPIKAFKEKTTPEICATFVLFCAAYAEFYATPLMADNDTCDMSCVHCGILAHLSAPNGFSLAL